MSGGYEQGSPMDEHIRSIERLMRRLNRIDEEIDEISAKIFSGNVTDTQIVRMIEHRNSLYIERKQKEARLKEQYKIVRTKK